MKELNYKESWSGDYKGVRFEVVHWRLGWNYYLYIPIKQLPDKIKPIFNLRTRKLQSSPESRVTIFYDYSNKRIISELDWHGGITDYNKERDELGKIVGFRLGCDYMHYWDENISYNSDSVIRDAKASIDKLWELVPNLKLRCAYNGEYYNHEDVFYTEHDVCVALVNKENWYKPI